MTFEIDETQDLANYLDILEYHSDARMVRKIAAENAALKEENERLEARMAGMESALKLALEYWQHRMQRYKNRSPVWVREAKEALKEPVNEGLEK